MSLATLPVSGFLGLLVHHPDIAPGAGLRRQLPSLRALSPCCCGYKATRTNLGLCTLGDIAAVVPQYDRHPALSRGLCMVHGAPVALPCNISVLTTLPCTAYWICSFLGLRTHHELPVLVLNTPVLCWVGTGVVPWEDITR